MTPPNTNPPANPTVPRRWGGRISLAVLALLGLLTLFHRPLLFYSSRLVAERIAAAHNLRLSYHVHGSIFSTLDITHLRLEPSKPGPIERFEVGAFHLRYSLPSLLRRHWRSAISELELHDATLVLDPAHWPPKRRTATGKKILRALLPERITLTNLNVTVRSPRGDTIIQGLNLTLDPGATGELSIRTLAPGRFGVWNDVRTRTSFHNRNLVLENLTLEPELTLRALSLQTSRLESGELDLALDGTLFDAPFSATLQISGLGRRTHFHASANTEHLPLETVLKALRKPPPVQGTLTRLVFSYDGSPSVPRDWSGSLTAHLQNLRLGAQSLGEAAVSLHLGEGRATLVLTQTPDENSRISIRAEGELPERLDGFPKTRASGNLEFHSEDLATLTGTLKKPVHGDTNARLTFRLHDGKLEADATVESRRVSVSELELLETAFTLHAEKTFPTPTPSLKQPPFAGLVTRFNGHSSGVRFRSYEIESLAVQLTSEERTVTLSKLSLQKTRNGLTLNGNYVLPDDLKSWNTQALDLQLSLDAPDLSVFARPGTPDQLGGELQIHGRAQTLHGETNGSFRLAGKAVRFQTLNIQHLGGTADIVHNIAYSPNLNLTFDARNHIDFGGQVQLAPPFQYNAWAEALLSDLSRFEALLAKPDKKTPLAGALALSWRGSGDFPHRTGSPSPPGPHRGAASLRLERGRFGAAEELGAHLVSGYDLPTSFHVPIFHLSTKQTEANARIHFENSLLKIEGIEVRQGKLPLVSGTIELPLDPTQLSPPSRMVPEDSALKIALTSRDLDLGALAVEVGQKNPFLSGILNADITASGSLRTLQADLRFRGRKIQTVQIPKLYPADCTLDLSLRNNRVVLSGSLNLRELQPLRFDGTLPLNVAALKNSGALDKKTPVHLALVLPRSSLGFVSAVVPKIRFLKGTAAIDFTVDGTLGKPELGGAIQADIVDLRMTDTSVPPVNNATLRLNFARDQLVVSQLRGGSAGGSFGASGTIGFPKLQEPVFDLRLTTQKALVVQNDNITARVSSDLKVTGPLKAGTVSGRIFLTKSRYFKDVDILPIGLPGRPPAHPPGEPRTISFSSPLLRDWKFDVAIRTQDPFLIRGNLTNGSGVVDLELGGTGLRPFLNGSVQVRDLIASLPFSRLTIDRGLLYFSSDAPFVPKLEIQASSVVRDYNITVYVYGTTRKPEALFTSEPPLPQSEIVALLATGVTTQEMAGDPNILAGRAAILLMQRYYRKLLTSNEPSQPRESFMNRVEVDLGGTDPRTGQQSLVARFKLSNEIVLSGGIGIGGNFRGMVKYLVRFH